MNLNNLNNLIELFVNQANKQNKKDIFLEWLNPSNKKTYTWEQTEKNILKLSKVIKENIKEGDRCLLVSENRPEWFISDLAIMKIGAITVPAYTTSNENELLYLLNHSESKLALLDEIDSGLDIDAIKTVANLINENRDDETSYLLVTHYSRILRYLDVDRVHIVVKGNVIKSGSKELIEEVDSGGYTQYQEQ